MKKFILLLACGLLFASCEPLQVRQGRRVYKAYFNYTLKDPSSLVIYDEDYTLDGDSQVIWEINYGAKNSYGAMVRSEIKFSTISNYSIWIDKLYGGGHYTMSELKGR